MNGSSLAEHRPPSVTYSHPHHPTAHSPVPLTSTNPPNHREAPYSKLNHASSKCSSHSLSGELLPGYSKLTLVDGPASLSPPSDSSRPKAQPAIEVASNPRASHIYGDLDDKDLETGIRGRKQFSPPPILSVCDTLEDPGHLAYYSHSNTRPRDYEMVVSTQGALKSLQDTTHSTLFDDPEYYPLKQPVSKSKVEIPDPRYVGNYERSPTYTCPMVTVGIDKLQPKYRGDYEWDPMYAPAPPPRRASVSCNQTQSVLKEQEAKVKVQHRRSLENEVLYKYRGDYERCPTYEPCALKVKEMETSQVLGKNYSGNYERDPVYMACLKRVEDGNSDGENFVCSSRLDIEGSARFLRTHNTHEFITDAQCDSIEQLDSLEPPFIEIADTFQQGTFIDI